MVRAVFMAVFAPERGGAFSVTFPDVPVAITQGEDFGEALLNAIDVLETVLEQMFERGEPIPLANHASLAARLEMDRTRVPVPVTLPGNSARVNIMIDESLLGRIDREAEARGQSRSGFLAEAAKTLLRSA